MNVHLLPLPALAVLVTFLDPMTMLALAQTCVRLSQLLSPADSSFLWRAHVAAQPALLPDSVHGLALIRFIRWGLFYAVMQRRERGEMETENPVVCVPRSETFVGHLAGEPSEYLTCEIEAALGPEALSRALRLMSTWLWNDPPLWRVLALRRALATVAFDLQCNQCGTRLTTQPLFYSPLGCVVNNDDISRKGLNMAERPKAFDVPLFVLATGEYQREHGTCPVFRCSPTVYMTSDEYLTNVTNGVRGMGCCGENNSERLCSSCGQEVAALSNDCAGPVSIAVHASRVSLIVEGSFSDSSMWKRRLLWAHTAVLPVGRGGRIR